MPTLRECVDVSIYEAEKAGKVDTKRHAAALEMLRKMAEAVDEADSASVFRNVTPNGFLTYLERLGMVPADGETVQNPASKLYELKAASKARRTG